MSVSGDPRTVCYVAVRTGRTFQQLDRRGAALRARGLHRRRKAARALPLAAHLPGSRCPITRRVERYRSTITADPRDVPQLPGGLRFLSATALPGDWQGRRARGESNTVRDSRPIRSRTARPTCSCRRGTAFNSFTSVVQPLLRGASIFGCETGAHALRRSSVAATTGKARWSPLPSAAASGRSRSGSRASAVVSRLRPARDPRSCYTTRPATTFPDGLGNSQRLAGTLPPRSPARVVERSSSTDPVEAFSRTFRLPDPTALRLLPSPVGDLVDTGDRP